MSEFERLRERVRQNRTARAGAIDAHAHTSTNATPTDGSTYAAGARVFDRITGEIGEVIHGSRENIVVPITERADR